MRRDLDGCHVVITGANTGIGRETASALARRGAAVTLACRSLERTRPVIEVLRAEADNARIDALALDLASLTSVRAAAAELLGRGQPIHVLVNNAGLAGARGLTVDGFELTFGTNHLGHFLWTDLLLERLRASTPARVVAVSSIAHEKSPTIDWDALRRPTASYTGFPEYRVSKLCNVLHAAELGRRLAGAGVTTYAVHPGVIASDIWRRLPWIVRAPALRFMRTPTEGARSSIRCAAAPELAVETGRYYDADGTPKPASELARDEALAAELWRRSERWVSLDGGR
jgi:NAD(P)-dependent dehydrogenase (short-subunit alcohol dehydrogenase family)